MITDPFTLRDPAALKTLTPCEKVDAGGDPNEDGPWARRWRCATHDAPWSSSNAGCYVADRRASAAAGEARKEREHQRRLAAEASRAGLLALIEPGCLIYSSTIVRSTPNLLPAGGVVVEVEDFADAEAGERERRYHVLDPWYKPVAHRVIAEWDVDRRTIEVASHSVLARLVRSLAWDLWEAGKPTRTGRIGRTSIDTRDADRVRWLGVLVRLLMGGT
jgi:hypothetical protein